MSMKNSDDTIEPATCRLVAQCLNQLRHSEVCGAISEQQVAYCDSTYTTYGTSGEQRFQNWDTQENSCISSAAEGGGGGRAMRTIRPGVDKQNAVLL